MEQTIPRRTVSMPQDTIDRVERLRAEGESFSAAVTRLIEAGADAGEGRRMPSYVGIARTGKPLPADEEELLAEIFAEMDPND